MCDQTEHSAREQALQLRMCRVSLHGPLSTGKWCTHASMMVTSAVPLRFLAVMRPPGPAPTITTRGLPIFAVPSVRKGNEKAYGHLPPDA